MSIEILDWSETKDNENIKLFILKNKNNMIAKITNYGAILVSCLVPDKQNKLIDVVLGFDNIKKYFINPSYFGATIGRNSNRIKNATFHLNSIPYFLDKNEKNNNLHSGFNCYCKRIWNYIVNQTDNSVSFSLLSSDNDQGFPGNFNIAVKYTLKDDNSLEINYLGNSDKPTIANMTNHSYFNLDGDNFISAMNHKLFINSNYFVEIDKELLPTGLLKNVKNTPMDFNISRIIDKEIDSNFNQLKLAGGYDHCYLLKGIKNNEIKKQSELFSDKSGIAMEVYTDAVGIQFYSGNFINKEIGKNHIIYMKRCAVCLETGFLPDSINQEKFPSPVLNFNDKYKTTTIYKFLIKK